MKERPLTGKTSLPRFRSTGTALLLCLALGAAARAQKEELLYSFSGGADGNYPRSGLLRDSKGNLYGTTYFGGASGAGTVFEITADGTQTVIYSFTDGADGGYPVAGLVRDSNGNLYGTTLGGGAFQDYGSVFELSPEHAGGCAVGTNTGNDWCETVLYSFAGQPDGANPWGGLIRTGNGNIYGTTFYGGADGNGTVFEITAGGVEKVLHSFTGGADGESPVGGLVMGKGGIYGVASAGGKGCASGCGTLFRVTTKGMFTLVHTFMGDLSDGAFPFGSLIKDSSNNLYGTTWEGGEHSVGTVFEMSEAGVETVLYSFNNGGGDGVYPYAGLVRDPKGNLYGTTYEGGSSDSGAVFELTAAGVETVLYSFVGPPGDGDLPYLGSLVRDSKGNLYGTTTYGGADNAGTVFKLTP